MALVASGSLPENVVLEIKARGLTFNPDDNYKSLLKTAGADARIFAALASAKITPGKESGVSEDPRLVQHLSAAGKMLRAKQYHEASTELGVAVTNDCGKVEDGFVMGNVVRDLTAEAKALRQLGRNEEAAKLEERTQSLPSAQTSPN